MRTPKDVPNELKRLINAIVKRSGDCESWLNGYITVNAYSNKI